MNMKIILSFYALILSSFLAFAQDLKFIKAYTVNSDQLNPDGKINEKFLAQILARAYEDEKLMDPHFSSASCLKAEKLAIAGSYNTLQIFRVDSTCVPGGEASFIIKEARHALAEAQALKTVSDIPGMEALAAPKKPPPGFLSLALPIASFSYTDAKNNKHYLSIMPMAKGRILCDFVKEYRDSTRSTKNAQRMRLAFGRYGKQLGNFHKRFMKADGQKVIGKTLVHNDLHCFNVFYDENSGIFTLIDNEGLATSAKNPETPADDILKIFLGVESTGEPWERRAMIQNIAPQEWYNLSLKYFLDGYSQAFPADKKKQIYSEFKKIFDLENYNPGWLKITPEKFRDLREKYIYPIVDNPSEGNIANEE